MKEENDLSYLQAVKEDLSDIPIMDFGNLALSDDLKINTRQTIYTVRFLGPPSQKKRLAGIQSTGKHLFDGRVTLIGSEVKSSPGGALTVLEGGLMVGFSAVFFDIVEERLLKLPVTQEVWLNGKRILPDFSRVPAREK
ncbi:MAG: hypothetical protein Q8P76_03950 [bacterium]|nr:hypothetical protein [bacterium]